MYQAGDTFYGSARQFGDSVLAGFPAVVVKVDGPAIQLAGHDLDRAWIKDVSRDDLRDNFYPVFGVSACHVYAELGALIGLISGGRALKDQLKSLAKESRPVKKPALVSVYEDHLRRPVLLVHRAGESCVVLPFQLTPLELACVDWQTFIDSHAPTSGDPVRLAEHLARYALAQGAAPDVLEVLAVHTKLARSDVSQALGKWAVAPDGGQAAAQLVDTAVIMPDLNSLERSKSVAEGLRDNMTNAEITDTLDLAPSWQAYVAWRRELGNPIKELAAMVASLKLPKPATAESTMATKKAAKKAGKPKVAKAATSETPVKAAVKVAAKPVVKGEKPKRVSVSSEMQRLILEGKLTDEQIFSQVQKQFSLADDKKGYVAWNRAFLKKQGVKVPEPKGAK